MGLGCLVHKLVRLYTGLMCSFILTLGVVFFLHAAQSYVLLRSDLGIFNLQSAKTAALMMFGNFAFPFSETAAISVASSGSVSPTMALHVDVWSFWLPMMLGSTIALYGLSGHLSLKYRNAAFLLPFGGLAVLFLIWQVEVSQMLANIAYKEEFTLTPGQTRLKVDQAIHHEMFKLSYGQFIEMLGVTGCTISAAKGRPGLRPVQVECKEDSME